MGIQLTVQYVGNDLQPIDKAKFVVDANEREDFKKSNASLEVAPQKLGDFNALDPFTLALILKIANAAGLTTILKGLFDLALERVKGKNQKVSIKVGEVSVEAPQGASQEELVALAQQLASVAKSFDKTHTK